MQCEDGIEDFGERTSIIGRAGGKCLRKKVEMKRCCGTSLPAEFLHRVCGLQQPDIAEADAGERHRIRKITASSCFH